jgi:DNA polymerase-3 subunit delta'
MARKLAHALLVAGPAGIGKLPLCQALASLLLCEQPAAGTACGGCRSCDLLTAGTHADLLRVGLEEKSRVIKIDQIRQLIDFVGKTPALGERKVILLGPAETMNINAANALLKCLEEPSASTTLLLYSHQISGLPPTVRSRCQTVAMAVPSREQALEWVQGISGSPESAGQLLDLCEGRPLKARDLFYSDGMEAQLVIRKGLQALLDGGLSALEFPQLVADLELPQVLELMQSALERYLRESSVSANGAVLRPGFILRDELARLQTAISRGANPNRQLIIEDCSAQLALAVGGKGSKC